MIDENVNVRISTAIPEGMIIWTNGECIVKVRLPGQGIIKPEHFTNVHFSAVDFPNGINSLLEFIPY